MDDLIVIILTLIIAAAGVIGQVKKKKQPQPEGDENQQKTTGDFWDFLDDLGGENQPNNITQAETEINVEPEKIQEVVKKKPEYTFIAEKEGRNSLVKQTAIKDEIKDLMDEEEEEKISDTFSLRKAVIYSEILNRKYT